MSQLKTDTVYTFAGNLASTIFIVLAYLLLARWLGAENWGLLGLAVLIPTVLANFASLGQVTVNHTFPGLHPQWRQGLFVQTLAVTLAGTALAAALTFAFFRLPIPRGVFDQLPAPAIAWSIALCPAIMLYNLLLALTRGLGRLRYGALVQSLRGLALLAFVLALYATGRLALLPALVAVVAAHLAAALAALPALADVLALHPRHLSRNLLKSSVSFGALIGLANLASFLLYRADQALLAYMVPAAQVGLYVAAVNVAERLRLVPQSVSNAFLPHLARARDDRARQVPQVFRYTAIISLASLALLGALGVPAIAWLYGREYLGAIAPFLLLIPGVAALGGSAIISAHFATRHRPQVAAWVGYLSLALNILLNLLLIPPLGISGAALASTLAYLAAAAAWLAFYQHDTGAPWQTMLPRLADARRLARILLTRGRLPDPDPEARP